MEDFEEFLSMARSLEKEVEEIPTFPAEEVAAVDINVINGMSETLESYLSSLSDSEVMAKEVAFICQEVGRRYREA